MFVAGTWFWRLFFRIHLGWTAAKSGTLTLTPHTFPMGFILFQGKVVINLMPKATCSTSHVPSPSQSDSWSWRRNDMAMKPWGKWRSSIGKLALEIWDIPLKPLAIIGIYIYILLEKGGHPYKLPIWLIYNYFGMFFPVNTVFFRHTDIKIPIG